MAVDSISTPAQAYRDILLGKKNEGRNAGNMLPGGADAFAALLAGSLRSAGISEAMAADSTRLAGGSGTANAASLMETLAAGAEKAAPDDNAFHPVDYSHIIRDLLRDPSFAEKTPREHGEGLQEDFERYAQEATEPYKEAGIPFVSFQMIGVFRVIDSIKLPEYDPNDDFATQMKKSSAFHDEVRRHQTPEYQAELARREELFSRLSKERRDDGTDERLRGDFNRLAARAALVKAGDTIEGFREEYAADPGAAIEKHAAELTEFMQSVNVTMRDGAISYSY